MNKTFHLVLVHGPHPRPTNYDEVYVFAIDNPGERLKIPWPEGMTATEALLHWKEQP